MKGALGLGECYEIIGFGRVMVTEVGDLGAVQYVKFSTGSRNEPICFESKAQSAAEL